MPEAETKSVAAEPGMLDAQLQFLKGVGPVKAKLLARLDLFTVGDLLGNFPVEHRDRATLTPIAKAPSGSALNFLAQIVDVTAKRFAGKEQIKACLRDSTGDTLDAIWWNPWIADKLTPYAWGIFSGKLSPFGSRKQLNSPEFELFDDPDVARGPHTGPGEAHASPNFGRIVPVYNLRPRRRSPSGEELPEIRIRQNSLRNWVWQALKSGAAKLLHEPLPANVRERYALMNVAEAVEQFHFPDNFEFRDRARRRLAFDDFFRVSLTVASRRVALERAAAAVRMPLAPAIFSRISARLPFSMTPAQTQAFQQIASDMSQAVAMHRLLQGDVGSGKTAVAVAALLLCVAHGHQAALLAPTEALAQQHFRTLSKWLENSRVNLALLSGSVKSSERAAIVSRLKAGEIHIVAGTHALFEEDVRFKSLALVVVDEQHKFGVAQALTLRAKARAPHVLVMTATPIPRTLTLTLYGDMDVSVLNESPPGRGELVTRWLKEVDRARAYKLILDEAKKGHATYIVLPRILSDQPSADPGLDGEASDFDLSASALPPKSTPKKGKRIASFLWSEVKGAEEEFKRVREHLPTLKVEMLHGRMSASEKQRVLDALNSGKVDVLVSTQVIEVGIDLAHATVMLIENAERFGLSGLHQLRGRVGRSPRKSYCLFFSESETEDAQARLKAFEKKRDGFEIAEIDFALRGPGQFFGTKQSGMPDLKVADPIRDEAILREAREAAFACVRSGVKSAPFPL